MKTNALAKATLGASSAQLVGRDTTVITKNWKKAVFQKVMYFPDSIREEPVNIGIILYEVDTDNAKLAVRITRDWRRVLCMDSDAPIEFLQRLEESLLQLQSPDQVHQTVGHINQHFSTGIQVSCHLDVTPAKALLTEKAFEEELDWLMLLYVEPRVNEECPPDHEE